MGDGRHPASWCLRKEEQVVNPEGALAVRTSSEDYMWDLMCSQRCRGGFQTWDFYVVSTDEYLPTFRIQCIPSKGRYLPENLNLRNLNHLGGRNFAPL